MSNPETTKATEPTDEQLCEVARALVRERGLSRAAVELDTNRETLMRFLAGLGIRRGSRELLRARLIPRLHSPPRAA